MSKFYLAARYPMKDEMKEHSTQLEQELGWVSNSGWVKDGEVGKTRAKIAEDDFKDISDSDVFILFTFPRGTETPGGGRFVEFGYAWAKGLTCYIVGHYENVFCHLFDAKVYPTLEDLILDHKVR